jgi:hypothetical protein
MKQMPVEGTKFREVDRAWKNLMNKVNTNTAALEVIKLDDLGQTLRDANAKLE